MSTKTSSLNASANNSPTSPINNSGGTQGNATPTVVKIKKELPSDEIKEFAENTMNELLGWYGFDSVDRLDISAKTSKLLQTAGLINAQQQQHQQQQMERRRSRSQRATALMQMHQQQQQQQQNDHLRSSGTSTSTSNNNTTTTTCSRPNYRGNDSTASDHDTRSSRDDDSKSPHSTGILPATNTFDEKSDNCCWCRRPVPENAPEFLTTSDGPRYCSESCFTQSRRASFKKAKTCDWCKHIRHAVSYVDFHDGATQLQFCSDKCLNQYKMQIFCKETQAHLDMNPHLKEQGMEAASNGANLITPDLWLKNCRSRSASPASTVSTSPIPPTSGGCGVRNLMERASVLRANSPVSPTAGKNGSTNTPSAAPSIAANYKPLISVAPVSKLMSKSPGIITQHRQSPKHNRKKRPLKSCTSTEGRQEPKGGNSATANPLLKPKSLLNPLPEPNRNNLSQTPSLTQFAASCVQDLHMNVPPLSPMLESPASSQPTTPHNLPPPAAATNGGRTTIPAAFFATPPTQHGGPPPPPAMGGTFTPRPHPPPPPLPFMGNPAAPWPRFLGNFMGMPPTAAAPSLAAPPDLSAFNALVGTPPPVTVMVPYPVIIPLPIPIPVPLPVVDFYKAYLTADERQKFDEERNGIKKEATTTATPSDSCCSASDEPLDFTKTKETTDYTSPMITDKTAKNPQEDMDDVREEGERQEEPETSANNTTTNSPTNGIATENPNSPRNLNESEDPLQNVENNPQRLPKLKITRLQSKRTLLIQQTKESECSRPLRKRKRIIDCDFQKITATTTKETNVENNDEDDDAEEDNGKDNQEAKNIRTTTTDMETTNNNNNIV
ncbi:sine oculis-binding protein homolog [Musca vetustissima]|uniref:sine oculis-binding protein homolog n=1 Tax=Musca vetustissima TaxID=27455 RepID=UPI002AB636A9|nr:sine oculis-binding protein homolog [Musca vetustissima]